MQIHFSPLQGNPKKILFVIGTSILFGRVEWQTVASNRAKLNTEIVDEMIFLKRFFVIKKTMNSKSKGMQMDEREMDETELLLANLY